MSDVSVLSVPRRRPEARTTAWVAVGVSLTLAAYAGAVVAPYLTGEGWDGPVLATALVTVQVAPLVALVAGLWSLHRVVLAARGGRARVAAVAGVSVVLCTVLAGLVVVSPGLAVVTALMD